MSFYSNLPSVGGTTSASTTPTLFEILSAEEINELLPTSIRYILTKYWIQNRPTRFNIQLNNWFDEWFSLILKSLVEWYHLKHYDATFINKFYGLLQYNGDSILQESIPSLSPQEPWPQLLRLTNKQRVALMGQEIVFPYLNEKLSQKYHQWIRQSQSLFQRNQINVETNDDGLTLREKVRLQLKQLIVKWYPYLTRTLSLVNLIIKVRFLSQKYGSHTTLLEYFFNIQYTRSMRPLEENNEMRIPPIAANKKTRLNNLFLLNKLNQLYKALVQDKLLWIGSTMFPSFIFLLKVYQWWNNENLTTKLNNSLNQLNKYIPKPSINNEAGEKQDTSHCIVCGNDISNPCIIETGCIACYPCMIQYLKEHNGKCPLTGKVLLGYSETDPNNFGNSIRRLLV
ncbi:ubiquitin-protein ligase peroxin 12 [Monosporozyma unispora]|nr:ubiquitin-protein ligase peroxin 12 [Kazachstania unispora]